MAAYRGSGINGPKVLDRIKPAPAPKPRGFVVPGVPVCTLASFILGFDLFALKFLMGHFF
jgi:hypothetical protein